jgi:hypothetical protein
MDPIVDHPAYVLQSFRRLPIDALLFQGADHPLHPAGLLRAMRRDELLLQPITSDQGRELLLVKHSQLSRRLLLFGNKLKIDASVLLGDRDEEVEVHGESDCWDSGLGRCRSTGGRGVQEARDQ